MLESNLQVGLRRYSLMRMGVGPYRGETSKVLVKPGWPDRGLVFYEKKRVGGLAIPARPGYIHATSPSLHLARQGSTVGSAEVLLAAIYMANNWELEVHVTGQEIPALDGSALPWVEALKASGLYRSAPASEQLVVRNRVALEGETWSAVVEPSDTPSLTVSIDIDHPGVGSQEVSVPLAQGALVEALAPARIFGFHLFEPPVTEDENAFPFEGEEDEEEKRRIVVDDRDQILRINLRRSLVFDHEGNVENEDGTRFDDEPVRFKALAALGYLALLGAPLIARVVLRNVPPSAFKPLLRRLETDGGLETVQVHG